MKNFALLSAALLCLNVGLFAQGQFTPGGPPQPATAHPTPASGAAMTIIRVATSPAVGMACTASDRQFFNYVTGLTHACVNGAIALLGGASANIPATFDLLAGSGTAGTAADSLVSLLYNSSNLTLYLGAGAGNATGTGTNNVVFGMNAGSALTAPYAQPQGDVFIGPYAGQNCTTCRESIFIGQYAGSALAGSLSNTGAEDTLSVFIGSYSGGNEPSGSIDNTYIGQKAGLNMANAADGNNVMIGAHGGAGWQSGQNNVFLGRATDAPTPGSSGSNNFFLGYQTAYTQGVKNDNIWLGLTAGYSAPTLNQTIYIGSGAGFSNVTGTDGVYIGHHAGYYDTGSDNTLIGFQAGDAATSMSQSTVLGSNAMSGAVTTAANTAIGYQALNHLTTGANETAVGANAGLNLTTSSDNTLLGVSAGNGLTTGTGRNIMIGEYTGYSDTTGNENTFLGYYAGYTNNNGNLNTYLGYESGFTGNCSSCSSNIGIGANSLVGGSATGAVQIGAGTNSTSNTIQFESYNLVDASGDYNFLSQTPTTLYSAAGTALPTCAVGIKGRLAVVSDATSPTYMGAYASGGAITANVICSYNGATYSWLTH